MAAIDYLQYVSILLEVAIAILCVRAALKGRTFMYGLAVTFGIYVFYDLVGLGVWTVPEFVLTVLFFVATLAALIRRVAAPTVRKLRSNFDVGALCRLTTRGPMRPAPSRTGEPLGR